MNFSIDTAGERYILLSECVSFDEVMERIEFYAIELVGRGKYPADYLTDPVAVPRGTEAAYVTMTALAEDLIAAAREDGETPVAGLSPPLIDLEGHAVEVETVDRRVRKFIVQKTDEPIPRHFEIAGDSRRQADYDYLQVLDLGPIR